MKPIARPRKAKRSAPTPTSVERERDHLGITTISEAIAFLALASIRGVGQESLTAISARGRSFAEALYHGPNNRTARLGKGSVSNSESTDPWPGIRQEALSKANDMMATLERVGVSIIFQGDALFPAQLLQLARPPQWLFVQGNVDVLNQPSIAVVGTRKPSSDGQFLTRYVGACLQDWQAPTVSGLALGIDQLAHEFSLRAHVPTIAVLGTGILENYPRGSEPLRHQILDAGGAIVSEYLPHTSYSADNFVQRNRLQAGLGRILIPTEWERRSGTAHTVRFATQLKRPIACLRLSDWERDRLTLEPGLGQESGRIFTVPREQGQFMAFVADALGGHPLLPAQQLSLFTEGR